jgi:hypothetical protein
VRGSLWLILGLASEQLPRRSLLSSPIRLEQDQFQRSSFDYACDEGNLQMAYPGQRSGQQYIVLVGSTDQSLH